MKCISPRVQTRRLAALYDKMAAAYARAAPEGFTCESCARNCCVSHFQHHTYLEWHYLWEGLNALARAKRDEYIERAGDNVARVGEALRQGLVPSVMCPVNEGGECGLYEHRLMICRMYGVPNIVVTPSGIRQFPGCPVCMEHLAGKQSVPVDRTPLYRELAALELALLGPRRNLLPKVDMTLAEMILAGPPK